nr:hypothetical protein [Comamonas jiangduensis]
MARQTRRLLAQQQRLRPEPAQTPPDACAQAHQIRLMTTGSLPSLQAAAQRWLQLPASCCATVQV